MMPVIDTNYAWRVIRDTRRHDPDEPWRPDAGLVIETDGAWSASGPVDDQAAKLFDTLLPVARGGPTHVLAQLGQSLDGRIATASGHSYYVTGRASRVHLHRLRALVDAVIVGAGTVAADDPQLTVRHVDGDSPARVVLDPNARVPATARVFTDGGPPTWHAVADPERAASGAQTLALDGPAGAFPPQRLLAMLAERGMRRVLVEGGGLTVSGFIDAGCVDRLHMVVAPMLIGSGRPGLALAEIETLAQARRPACRSYALGPDRLYDLDLRVETPAE